MKTIGLITSGGDCGGLNAVVKGAAQMATRKDITTYAIPNGYAGLYNLVDLDNLVALTPGRLDSFSIGLAGSEAGHSRVKISKIKDPNKYQRIKDGLAKFGIDALVISGGDDTGSVVADLDAQGIHCVHCPKTMDLDLMPYSVGGDSTINRIGFFVSELKTTGRTHNRIMVIEVFGRYAGHTAFRGGVAGEADCILIPEIPVDFDEVYRHMKKVFTKRVIESDINAGTYTIVVAEGLRNASGEPIYDESAGVDTFGHKKLAGAGKYVAQELKKKMAGDHEIKEFMIREGMFVEDLYTLPEIRTVTPSHLVRAGTTSAYDANFGMIAGASAVNLLLHDVGGVTVTGFHNNKVYYMKIKEAIKQRHVDLDDVNLFEQLGFCFGRVRQEFDPESAEEKRLIQRIY
ncbi:MAG: 6-phosphofructokinase [candidate division Zixibacteria bacterium]|nr:6-phosphofructokinase [candidate division Zixibacteria bacterium]